MKMDANHIYFKAPAGSQNVMKYKADAVWSAKEQAWKIPKSPYALRELSTLFPRLKEVDTYNQTLTTLETARERLKQAKKQQAQNDSDDENDKLRPYQRQDVQYLTTIPHAGVFNQPRTGKTPTMIETIKARGTIKNIIICPASLQYNWKREIEQWHEQANTYMYTGTPKNRKEALEHFQSHVTIPAYLIMSKDTAKRDLAALTFAHDVLVIDEAHYLRNRETAQSKAIYSLGKHARHRYALTGTPTVKHPSDVFGILHFLYPDKFSSYWAFINRYFDTASNGFGTEIGNLKKHRATELSDLIDAMTTQRLRKDVMQWLPDKQKTVHYVRLSKKQEKLYLQMAEDFIAKLDESDDGIDAQNVLAQLMRLRQICLEPSLLGLDTPSAKTEALLEAIEDGTYDEPIIIMSMFTSYLKHLAPQIQALGKRVGMIHGEMSNKEKNDTAQAFQAGKIDVLLCNIISAGTGFTLDRGEVIIFTDKAWNPSDNEQAEDRITPTQKDRMHKHTIVSFVCENTVEQHIERILERKQSLTSFINQCKSVDQLRTLLL